MERIFFDIYNILNSGENPLKVIINEEIFNINESKQTEQQAINYLIKNSNTNKSQAELLINQFKRFDTTQNQKILPVIAVSYLQHKNINDLSSVFRTVSEFMNQGKIKSLNYTENGYVINNDKVFPDWLRFTEYIHGLESMTRGHKK